MTDNTEKSPSVQEAQVAAWSALPVDILEGMCPDPDCAEAACASPRLLFVKVSSPVYAGPLVVVRYAMADGQRRIRINDLDFPNVPGSEVTTRGLGRALDRYGPPALSAFIEHGTVAERHLYERTVPRDGDAVRGPHGYAPKHGKYSITMRGRRRTPAGTEPPCVQITVGDGFGFESDVLDAQLEALLVHLDEMADAELAGPPSDTHH